MAEFNIVRLNLKEWTGVEQPGYHYCDYTNFGLDLFYYRYGRDYVEDMIGLKGGVEMIETMMPYVGKHFNVITVSPTITLEWLDDIKTKTVAGLPVCIYVPSWKIFKFPLEVLEEVQRRGWYIILDESYEGFVDHLNPFWMWMMFSGFKDFSFIRVISGRFNGHPACKHNDIQNVDLDLDFTGLRICSFPYFWFRSVDMYRDLKNTPINLERDSGTLMCYNNILRQHRMLTLADIYRKGFLDRITWSAIGNTDNLFQSHGEFGEHRIKSLGVNWVDDDVKDYFKRTLPKTVDCTLEHDSLVARPDAGVYESHIFNLVTETSYGVGEWDTCGVNAMPMFSPNSESYAQVKQLHRRYGFITEKTYKAIVFGQVFLIVGSINSLTHLRKLGFQTFSSRFSESYDHEIDDSQRYLKIVDIAENLINNRWNLNDDWEVRYILQHNKEHFFDPTALTETAYDLVDFMREHIR